MLSHSLFHLHQTSRHAIIVMHFRGIDALSVVTSISQDHVEINFQHTEDQPLTRVTTLIVKPQSEQLGGLGGQELGKVGGCSISVTRENMVVKMVKTQGLEWQALALDIRDRVVDNDEKEKEETESIVVKFVTKNNATCLQKSIRTKTWSEDGDLHVGNIQAKKISGENAIKMSAELVQ